MFYQFPWWRNDWNGYRVLSTMKTKLKKKEIKVRLTNKDLDHLNNLVKESNLSRESYLRMCINGLIPRPAPSKELIEVIEILREIAEDMNQIAISVYAQNEFDKSSYMQNYEKLQEQITEIMILIRQPIDITTPLLETKTN